MNLNTISLPTKERPQISPEAARCQATMVYRNIRIQMMIYLGNYFENIVPFKNSHVSTFPAYFYDPLHKGKENWTCLN
jgi:hypothetical protein